MLPSDCIKIATDVSLTQESVECLIISMNKLCEIPENDAIFTLHVPRHKLGDAISIARNYLDTSAIFKESPRFYLNILPQDEMIGNEWCISYGLVKMEPTNA